MTYVPYGHANDLVDRFLALLAGRGINPPSRSATEEEFLSLADLMEIWRDPARVRNLDNDKLTIRQAAGIHDLAAKVLCAENLPKFASFEEHLKLIGEAEEFTKITQNTKDRGDDDIARKIAELSTASPRTKSSWF